MKRFWLLSNTFLIFYQCEYRPQRKATLQKHTTITLKQINISLWKQYIILVQLGTYTNNGLHCDGCCGAKCKNGNLWQVLKGAKNGPLLHQHVQALNLLIRVGWISETNQK